MSHKGSALGEEADFEASVAADLPRRGGHKTSFNH